MGDPGLIPGWGTHWSGQFLSGKFCGQRSLVSYSPQGLKESDTTERLTHTHMHTHTHSHREKREKAMIGKGKSRRKGTEV